MGHVVSLVPRLGVCSIPFKKGNNLFKEMAKASVYQVIETFTCVVGTLDFLQRGKALPQTDRISAVPGTPIPPF